MLHALEQPGLKFENLKSQDFYRTLLDQIADGVYMVDTRRRILYWNRSAERISGYSFEKVIGSYCVNNLLRHVNEAGVQLCTDGCPLQATMQDGVSRQADVFLHHRDGHRVPVHVYTMAIYDQEGRIQGAVETFRDNSAHVLALKRIQELENVAFLDSLTGLVNRRYMDGIFESRFASLKRHHTPFGVIFGDVDHFKQFNDTHGHEAGDKVLQTVSQTLAHNCRPYDTVGRWGGEEFLVITAHADGEELRQLAERLRILIRQSHVQVQEAELFVTVSFGATLARRDDTAETLLHRADALLYQSKAQGRDRVTYEEEKILTPLH